MFEKTRGKVHNKLFSAMTKLTIAIIVLWLLWIVVFKLIKPFDHWSSEYHIHKTFSSFANIHDWDDYIISEGTDTLAVKLSPLESYCYIIEFEGNKYEIYAYRFENYIHALDYVKLTGGNAATDGMTLLVVRTFPYRFTTYYTINSTQVLRIKSESSDNIISLIDAFPQIFDIDTKWWD